MKKFLSVLLIASMVFGVAACRSDKKTTRKKRREQKIKYASEYDLENGDREYVLDDSWEIWKREGNDVTFLDISSCGKAETDPRDYIRFLVFDTASEAKDYYEERYDSSKEYGGGTWEEGDNWFVSQEPYVCDAGIIWMNYLSGNVIITADLDCWSEWAEYYDEEATPTPTPTEPPFDTYTLKDYILENADELEEFAIHDVLGY